MYRNRSKLCPWAINLRSSSKGGGGCIFELEDTPASHTVSLTLIMYACCHSAMPLLSFAYLCNNSKWCLPSLAVTASSCTVLLLWCFSLIYQHVLQQKWVGILSREKHPLQQLHSKKGGLIFKGRVILRDYGIYIHTHTSGILIKGGSNLVTNLATNVVLICLG